MEINLSSCAINESIHTAFTLLLSHLCSLLRVDASARSREQQHAQALRDVGSGFLHRSPLLAGQTPRGRGNHGAHSSNDTARIRRRASDDATYAGRSRKRAHENGGARSWYNLKIYTRPQSPPPRHRRDVTAVLGTILTPRSPTASGPCASSCPSCAPPTASARSTCSSGACRAGCRCTSHSSP
jgi:hypothetical protein